MTKLQNNIEMVWVKQENAVWSCCPVAAGRRSCVASRALCRLHASYLLDMYAKMVQSVTINLAYRTALNKQPINLTIAAIKGTDELLPGLMPF